jgi:hypothetical protein
MPSSIAGRSRAASTSASSVRRRAGIVMPSGLCSVGWTYTARTCASRTADGSRPRSSISSGTSVTPSLVATAFTTGYVMASTPSLPPTGTSAAIAAAMACLPLPANRIRSGSGVQPVRASNRTAAARAVGVPSTVDGRRVSASTSGRSSRARLDDSSSAWSGSTGKFSSRSTRAVAGSARAGSGPGAAARTNVPRPTSPTARPRRTSSPYTRAAVDAAMPCRRANPRCGGSRSPARSLPAAMSSAIRSAIRR